MGRRAAKPIDESSERPPRRTARPLPRNVKLLSLVSFCQDSASEMLYPVLPLFITTVLGAPASVVGLVEGVAEGTASAMKAVAGRWADRRVHRRPLVAWGYGIAAAGKAVVAVATVWPMVLLGRFIDRTGKGIRAAPRDALIVEAVPAADLGRAFGFHRAADTAGAVVGPLIGLALYDLLGHRVRVLFVVALVPAVVSVLLVYLVKEHVRSDAAAATSEHVPGPPMSALPARYWRVVIVLAVFGLANFSDALLLLRAKALGLGVGAVIGVYILYNVSYSALGYPAGAISDRVPRRLVYSTGLAIFAVSYLGLGLVTTGAWVWLLLPVYGGYTALTDGVGKAWIADLTPRSVMASGLGLFQGLTGGTAFVAGLWAGLAWGGDGRLPLILSGSVVAVVTVALFAFGSWLEQPRQHAVAA